MLKEKTLYEKAISQLRKWRKVVRQQDPKVIKLLIIVIFLNALFILGFFMWFSFHKEKTDIRFDKIQKKLGIVQSDALTCKLGLDREIANPKDVRSLRIYMGNYDFAFQPTIFCGELKANNITCVSSDEEEHPFGSYTDFRLHDHCNRVCWDRLQHKFDIIHIHETAPYTPLTGAGLYEFITRLRNESKCVIFQVHGTDYRPIDAYMHMNRWGALHESRDSKIVWERIRAVEASANAIIAGDPEMGSYIKATAIVPRVLRLEQYPYFGASDSKVPLIVHAPSQPAVKGTRFIHEALEELRKEGYTFEYVELTNKKHDEVMRILQRSDIVLDQFKIGWYGVFTSEAMSLGKPVIVYIREDLKETLGTPPPVHFANPKQIKESIKKLILDVPYRQQLGKDARRFAEYTHNVTVHAKRLLDIYQEYCIDNPPPVKPFLK